MVYDKLGGVKVECTGVTHTFLCQLLRNELMPSMHRMRSQLVRKGLIQGHKRFHQYSYPRPLCVLLAVGINPVVGINPLVGINPPVDKTNSRTAQLTLAKPQLVLTL